MKNVNLLDFQMNSILNDVYAIYRYEKGISFPSAKRMCYLK